MLTRARAKVQNLNAEQFVNAASPGATTKITGTFKADARLAIPLGATDPLMRLSGKGQFAVHDGTFLGLDIEGTLAKMAKLLQLNLPVGDTRFTFLGGDFRISKARIHSNRLRLDAEALKASLRGSVGFDQTLNYNGSGLLKGEATTQQQKKPSRNPFGGLRRGLGIVTRQTMKITGMRVPFTVRGTLQDPKIRGGR